MCTSGFVNVGVVFFHILHSVALPQQSRCTVTCVLTPLLHGTGCGGGVNTRRVLHTKGARVEDMIDALLLALFSVQYHPCK